MLYPTYPVCGNSEIKAFKSPIIQATKREKQLAALCLYFVSNKPGNCDECENVHLLIQKTELYSQQFQDSTS